MCTAPIAFGATANRIRVIDADGTISTIAGTGKTESTGDSGPAVDAQLSHPIALAVTADGRILVVEGAGNRVRVIGADGIITTLAGTGVAGSAGDGGDARAAQLNHPATVAVAKDGRVLIAEEIGNRVRAVGADGKISTFAGTGEVGSSADDTGPATMSNVSLPQAVQTTPDGLVIVIDLFGLRVIDPRGNILTLATTWANSSEKGELRYVANSIAIRRDGRLLVVDRLCHLVLLIDPDGRTSFAVGAIRPAAGPSKASAALLNDVQSLAAMADGRIRLGERVAHRVRVIGTDGVISTFAGTGEAGWSGDGGPASKAKLDAPSGLAVAADGRVLIAEPTRLRSVDWNGLISTIAATSDLASSEDGGPARSASFDLLADAAFMSDGRIVLAEFAGNRVRMIDTNGTITTIAGTGTAGSRGDGGPATTAQLDQPSCVATAPDGQVVISDIGGRVRVIGLDGQISTMAGTGTAGSKGDGGAAAKAELDRPQRVVVTQDRRVLIAQPHQVRVVTP